MRTWESDELDGRLHQPKTMRMSRFVVSQLDDDFIRRLMDAIEEACGAYDDPRTHAEVVEECIDGDLFLAYQGLRKMFKAAYPELYEDTE